jgi:hypothetical protein
MLLVETVDDWTSDYIKRRERSLSNLLGASNPDEFMRREVTRLKASITSAKLHRLASGLNNQPTCT